MYNSLVFARKDKGLVVCGLGILITTYSFVKKKKSMIKNASNVTVTFCSDYVGFK